MGKLVMAAVIAIVIGSGLGARQALANSALLEVDTNGNGDVLEIRDGKGKPLDHAAFGGIGGFDFIAISELSFGEVVGNPTSCCWRGGKWYPPSLCAQAGFTGKSSTLMIGDTGEVTRVDGLVDGVWREDLKEAGSGRIHSATIKSFKSDVVAVVERNGTLYGIVITSESDGGGGQTIWYDGNVFTPNSK
jgi:hypothetical protein